MCAGFFACCFWSPHPTPMFVWGILVLLLVFSTRRFVSAHSSFRPLVAQKSGFFVALVLALLFLLTHVCWVCGACGVGGVSAALPGTLVASATALAYVLSCFGSVIAINVSALILVGALLVGASVSVGLPAFILAASSFGLLYGPLCWVLCLAPQVGFLFLYVVVFWFLVRIPAQLAWLLRWCRAIPLGRPWRSWAQTLSEWPRALAGAWGASPVPPRLGVAFRRIGLR
jgi:hypothetical protein